MISFRADEHTAAWLAERSRPGESRGEAARRQLRLWQFARKRVLAEVELPLDWATFVGFVHKTWTGPVQNRLGLYGTLNTVQRLLVDGNKWRVDRDQIIGWASGLTTLQDAVLSDAFFEWADNRYDESPAGFALAEILVLHNPRTVNRPHTSTRKKL